MTPKAFISSVLLLITVGYLKAQPALSVASPDNIAPPVLFQQSVGTLPKPNFYKEKVLVIDFWATWCAPCIAGFPEFTHLISTYKGNKSIAFAAMTDEPKSIVERFLEELTNN